MARYISIGIATKIRVEKIDSLMSISELMRSTCEKFDFDLYDIYSEGRYYDLVLKRDVLEENLYSLIEEIRDMVDERTRKKYDKTLDRIKEKSLEEILSYSEEEESYLSFEKGYITPGIIVNDVSYLFYDTLGASCDIINIEIGDKIFYNYCSGMFNLLRNSFIASLNNRLRYALVITAIGQLIERRVQVVFSKRGRKII